LSSVLGPLRSLSLSRVLSDIDWFLSSGYSQVRFADRTFNQDPTRAKAIIAHILARPESQVMFHFEIRPDLLTPDLIDLLGTAPEGRFHLEIGVQSTHGPTLDAVHRHSNLQATGTRVRELRARTKCHIHLDLLAGLPQEGFPEFQKTLEETMSWKPTTLAPWIS
jgi:coproporphyrinogen III oxidase-like Fe-S oxidoreductase